MNEETLIRQFAAHITMEFAVHKVTVYRNLEKIYGDELECMMLERCLSLSCTTIFKDTNGSMMISQIILKNTRYLFVLTAKEQNAFDGLDAQYIIHELKTLRERLGDV